MLLDLLTVAVLGWVGSRLVLTARQSTHSKARRRIVVLLRGLRLRHFAMAVPVLFVVLIAAVLLLEVPGLSFGWWTAIGGQGNPVVGSTERTVGTPLEWILPLVFLVLLVPALPLLVEREEQIFRLGSEHRTFVGQVRRGLEFGLVHAIIGIPIGVALALSIGGWYFTWRYLWGWRRGGPSAGLAESTRCHLAYNLTVLAVVALAIGGGA